MLDTSDGVYVCMVNCSDSEGSVWLWDVATRQVVNDYDAHDRRIWALDFSPTDPHTLITGSDDTHAKVRLMGYQAFINVRLSMAHVPLLGHRKRAVLLL